MNNSLLSFVIRFVVQVFWGVLASRPVLWFYGIVVRRLVVKLDIENEWCKALLDSGCVSLLVVLVVVCSLLMICRNVLKKLTLIGRRIFCVVVCMVTFVLQGLEVSWHSLSGGGRSDIRTKLIVSNRALYPEERKGRPDNLIVSLERKQGHCRWFERFDLTDMEGYSIIKSDDGWVGFVYLNNTARDRLFVCLGTNEYIGYRVVSKQSSGFYEIGKAVHNGRIVVCKAAEESKVIDFLVDVTTHGISIGCEPIVDNSR